MAKTSSRGAAKVPCLDEHRESVVVDDPAAARVDDDRTSWQEAEPTGVEESARLGVNARLTTRISEPAMSVSRSLHVAPPDSSAGRGWRVQ